MIKSALARALTPPIALRDANLLPKSGSLLIKAEVFDSPVPVTEMLLPAAYPRPLHIRREHDLQEEADLADRAVTYLFVASPEIHGIEATIWVGVDIAIPTREHAGKLCCCVEIDRFELVDHEWRFVEVEGGMCA